MVAYSWFISHLVVTLAKINNPHCPETIMARFTYKKKLVKITLICLYAKFLFLKNVVSNVPVLKGWAGETDERLYTWAGPSFTLSKISGKAVVADSNSSCAMPRIEFGDPTSGHRYSKGEAVLSVNSTLPLFRAGLLQWGNSAMRAYSAMSRDIFNVIIQTGE